MIKIISLVALYLKEERVCRLPFDTYQQNLLKTGAILNKGNNKNENR